MCAFGLYLYTSLNVSTQTNTVNKQSWTRTLFIFTDD